MKKPDALVLWNPPAEGLTQVAAQDLTWACEVTELESQAAYNRAATIRNQLRSDINRLDEGFKAELKPFEDAKKQAKAQLVALTESFKTAIENLETKIKAFDEAELAIVRKKAEQKAKREERKGNIEFAADLRQQAAAAKVEQIGSGIGYSTQRRVVVSNPQCFLGAAAQAQLSTAIVNAMIDAAQTIMTRMRTQSDFILPAGCAIHEESVLRTKRN